MDYTCTGAPIRPNFNRRCVQVGREAYADLYDFSPNSAVLYLLRELQHSGREQQSDPSSCAGVVGTCFSRI
jgi:hypothetical protein